MLAALAPIVVDHAGLLGLAIVLPVVDHRQHVLVHQLLIHDHPVERVVVLVTLLHKQLLEHLAQMAVVRAVLETQGAAIVQVRGKLWWEAVTQLLDWCTQLHFTDLVIFFRSVINLQILPWQHPDSKVRQYIPNSFQVIPPALFNP